MSEMMQTEEVATDDLRILTYAQHMVQTARCDSAKRLFELFAEQEKLRIEANGGFQLLANGHETGGSQTAPDSAAEDGSEPLTRSGSRIDKTKIKRKKSNKTRGKTTKKAAGGKGKKVSFHVTAEPGSEVFVAGSFNDWNPTQHRMSDNPGSGHCKTTILLPPGRHEYKFVVNGEWRIDPTCPDSVPNESGSLNSVLTV